VARGGPQPEQLAVLLEPPAGQVPVGGLHQVQQRQHRRALLGIAGDDRLRLPALLVGEHRHQRSTPPITGSMLLTHAMTSATSPPSSMAGSDWRFTNEGSRTRTRYGRFD